MSTFNTPDSDMTAFGDPSIDTVLLPRTHDIGGFEVHRALPSKTRRLIGPFIFFDQMGPGEFVTGKGLDVRPHPHINLSTVTYLFEGAITHRDSLGTYQNIKPGAVNLMTAGTGITHSERTAAEDRLSPSPLFGIQSWLALPEYMEESNPSFAHIGKEELPHIEADDGVRMRLIMGKAFGHSSPVPMHHETLYLDIVMKKGARLTLPKQMSEELAFYPLQGRVKIGDTVYDPHRMLILKASEAYDITALDDVRGVLIGGAAMDGPRHIWWNFVSSSKERIEQAKEDWKAGRFDPVPHDEEEFIPLPE